MGGYVQYGLLVLSALFGATLSVCYWRRPDSWAAVSFWPVWLWLAPGLALAAPGFNRRRVRPAVAVIALWLVFLAAFAEEPRSLLRLGAALAPEARGRPRHGEVLRVISINCAGGNRLAAAEVIPYRPDVVLLQETPKRADVERLARRLFGRNGGIAHGVDTDIVARGRVSAVPLQGRIPFSFIQAQVRLPSGLETEIFSVHLQPPAVRFDIWMSACWRDHAVNRRVHREQASELAREVASLPLDKPVILGGDSTCPAATARCGCYGRACTIRSAKAVVAGATRS